MDHIRICKEITVCLLANHQSSKNIHNLRLTLSLNEELNKTFVFSSCGASISGILLTAVGSKGISEDGERLCQLLSSSAYANPISSIYLWIVI